MQYLKIKNHDKYQHYSTRNPPWIKLYRSILTDYDLLQVPEISRLCFIYLTIIASETDNQIPSDLNYLGHRFGFTVTKAHLTPLINRGLLLASSASVLLAEGHITSSLSLSSLNSLNSSEGKESEKGEGFDQFWAAYPKKVGKIDARKAFTRAKDKPVPKEMIAILEQQKRSEQWRKNNGEFIPNPATWLNRGGWEDQLTNGHDPMKAMVQAFVERGNDD